MTHDTDTRSPRRVGCGRRGPERALALMAIVCAVAAGEVRGQEPTHEARAENVRVEHVGFGVVHVYYDLTSDTPDTPEQVTLQVAMGEGEPFNMVATSVSGDIGAAVRPGPGKQVIWEAGQDVETVATERFRFRIVIGTGIRLVIVTSPAGAQVFIDGTMRGDTPLNLNDLPPGEHQIRVIREGFLENSQVVMLEPGADERVEVPLTAVTANQPVVESAGGGSRLPLILGIVGGGAAAGIVAATSGGDSPVSPPPAPLCVPRVENFSGTLTLSDSFAPGRPGSRADSYLLALQAGVGQSVTIRMSSPDFDTFLILLDPNRMEVARDDDGGGGLNSAIFGYVPPVTGNYSIQATGFSEFDLGAYTVTANISCS